LFIHQIPRLSHFFKLWFYKTLPLLFHRPVIKKLFYMCRTLYLNIADIIINLQARGFNYDFSITCNQLICLQEELCLKPCEFEITEMHYFRKTRQTQQEKMLFAISAVEYCIKGILLITGGSNKTIFPELIYNKIQEGIHNNRHSFDNGIL